MSHDHGIAPPTAVPQHPLAVRARRRQAARDVGHRLRDHLAIIESRGSLPDHAPCPPEALAAARAAVAQHDADVAAGWLPPDSKEPDSIEVAAELSALNARSDSIAMSGATVAYFLEQASSLRTQARRQRGRRTVVRRGLRLRERGTHRRAARRRTTRSSQASGDSGSDEGPGESPGLALRPHPRWGRCSLSLLAVLAGTKAAR